MNDQLILLIVRLIAGSLAGFTGILLWSRTRDPSWLFIIVSSILFYGVIVYDALLFFGALNNLPFGPQGRLLSEAILRGIPYVFLSIGFILRRRS